MKFRDDLERVKGIEVIGIVEILNGGYFFGNKGFNRLVGVACQSFRRGVGYHVVMVGKGLRWFRCSYIEFCFSWIFVCFGIRRLFCYKCTEEKGMCNFGSSFGGL